jgi:arabinofuranan 3-O-arabinosyltransferase
VHRTEVTGTLHDVVAGRPLAWRTCDGPVSLGPGTHRLVAEPTVQFRPVTLTWRPDGGSGPGRDDGGADDRLRITSWDDVRRVVTVTAGPESILRIAENVNAGWRATLDGELLEPVVLDGWQQGYRIPAGQGGDVVLEFAPDRWYRTALVAGLVLAVVLVGLAGAAVVRSRRDRSGVGTDLRSPGRVLGVAAALAVGAGALMLGGIPLAAGWLAGSLPPVRRWAPALGVAALVTGGVLAATSSGLAIGRPGAWADAAAALGLGLLLAQLVRVRGPRVPRRAAGRA